jgi:anti-repressor protein
MNNQIKIFDNPRFGAVRIVTTENNEPLFCLTDVCQALDLRQGDVRQRLDDGVVSTQPIYDSLGRQQNANFVNEDGLYDVILDSRKPEAKAFRKWITSEVLPSIRKNGGYIATSEDDTPELILARAVLLADRTIQKLQQEKLIAEQTIEEQRPKVEFFDDIMSSCDVIDMAQVAKTLNLGFGRNELFKILRSEGFLRENNEPYQTYINSGLFKTIPILYTTLYGKKKISIKTVVYPKGLNKIRELILNKYY